jgi:GNAT superfamily N-acetyltransferase
MSATERDIALERDVVHAIQLRAFGDFFEMMARSSPEARVVEFEGVAALTVPTVPRRSIPNSVVYRETEGLASALDELASHYDQAGIEAWTVWVPDFDREAIELLEDAGHAYDGQPGAMVLDLADLAERDLGDLDWELTEDMPLVGEINDRAYGHTTDGYAAAFAEFPHGLPVRLYVALADGEPASCLGTIDHRPVEGAAGPDCGIYWVATPEEYRGRGLSSRLLYAALVEARERGCATSSLQASSMGYPIYEKLGYQAPYRYHLYERRKG